MGRLPFILRSRTINYFNPNVGLTNFIVPMGCVLYLARELNYRPVVFWTNDAMVGHVNFSDLFETAELPFELVEGVEAKVTRAVMNGYPWGTKPFDKILFKLIRPAIQVQYGKRIIKAFQGTIRDKSIADLPSRSFAVVSDAYFRYGCDVSWLKPIPEINSQIIELKKQFTPNTVGVHIRGTDKKLERYGVRYQSSMAFVPPIEKLITRMHAEVELNPEVKFFVTSDGDESENRIRDLFKERVITAERDERRKTLGGQKLGVRDLFALAATSRIIHFRYSSFAILAALVGNKPLTRLRCEF